MSLVVVRLRRAAGLRAWCFEMVLGLKRPSPRARKIKHHHSAVHFVARFTPLSPPTSIHHLPATLLMESGEASLADLSHLTHSSDRRQRSIKRRHVYITGRGT